MKYAHRKVESLKLKDDIANDERLQKALQVINWDNVSDTLHTELNHLNNAIMYAERMIPEMMLLDRPSSCHTMIMERDQMIERAQQIAIRTR